MLSSWSMTVGLGWSCLKDNIFKDISHVWNMSSCFETWAWQLSFDLLMFEPFFWKPTRAHKILSCFVKKVKWRLRMLSFWQGSKQSSHSSAIFARMLAVFRTFDVWLMGARNHLLYATGPFAGLVQSNHDVVWCCVVVWWLRGALWCLCGHFVMVVCCHSGGSCLC